MTVEEIKKLGERYNSSLAKIGELMSEIAKEIQNIPYDSFKVKNLIWRRDFLFHNPRWSYGPGFAWIHYDDEVGLHFERIIDPRGANKSWYHAGDFQCRLSSASAKEFREAAKLLPEFLAKLQETLEKETSESEELQEKLEKMLKALEG